MHNFSCSEDLSISKQVSINAWWNIQYWYILRVVIPFSLTSMAIINESYLYRNVLLYLARRFWSIVKIKGKIMCVINIDGKIRILFLLFSFPPKWFHYICSIHSICHPPPLCPPCNPFYYIFPSSYFTACLFIILW